MGKASKYKNNFLTTPLQLLLTNEIRIEVKVKKKSVMTVGRKEKRTNPLTIRNTFQSECHVSCLI